MTATELAHRLDNARLVSGGPRGALPRHQSLVAAIDWSYRLLSEPERALFARLSLFAGGFDLAAAHGVCGDPGSTEEDTLDLLTALVDKSMVVAGTGPGRSRYLVLETLRAYGRERLGEAGTADRFARRHAAYFVALAEQGARAVQGPDEQRWVERVLPDYANLRAAFERAVADRDADLALRLVTSLPELAHLRVGYESAHWAERTLDLADPEHPLFAAAVGAAARGAWNRGDFARARELATAAGGRVPGRGTGRIAYPGDVLADVALYEGDAAAALRHYRAEMLRARRDDDPIRLVWTLYYVAVCHAVLRAPEHGLPAARGGGAGGRADGQPDRTVDGAVRARPRAQEVRPGPGARAVRRGRRARRVGAQLLVARHRPDGGRRHPGRARRSGTRVPGLPRRPRPLGAGRRLEPAVDRPAVRGAPAGPPRRRRGRGRAAHRARRCGQTVPAARRPPRRPRPRTSATSGTPTRWRPARNSPDRRWLRTPAPASPATCDQGISRPPKERRCVGPQACRT